MEVLALRIFPRPVPHQLFNKQVIVLTVIKADLDGALSRGHQSAIRSCLHSYNIRAGHQWMINFNGHAIYVASQNPSQDDINDLRVVLPTTVNPKHEPVYIFLDSDLLLPVPLLFTNPDPKKNKRASTTADQVNDRWRTSPKERRCIALKPRRPK